MKIETQSVITSPLEDESITVTYANGDLIVDAPLTATRGNITLQAQNIYLTYRGTLFANNGGINIETNQQFKSSGTRIQCTGKLRVVAGTSPTLSKTDPKSRANQLISIFNKATLRNVKDADKNTYSRSLATV